MISITAGPLKRPPSGTCFLRLKDGRDAPLSQSGSHRTPSGSGALGKNGGALIPVRTCSSMTPVPAARRKGPGGFLSGDPPFQKKKTPCFACGLGSRHPPGAFSYTKPACGGKTASGRGGRLQEMPSAVPIQEGNGRAAAGGFGFAPPR